MHSQKYKNGYGFKYTQDEKRRYHSFNDEPAIIFTGANERCWYKHGLYHRETGAAIIRPDGTKEFWLDGIEYSFNEWINKISVSEEQRTEFLLEYDYESIHDERNNNA